MEATYVSVIMELLNRADAEACQEEEGFWRQLKYPKSVDSKYATKEGPLWVLQDDKFRKRHFVLVKNVFFCYQSKKAKRYSKWVRVTWKVFKPFVDVGEGDQVRYGFSIGSSDCVEEFYTMDPAYLNEWVLAFRAVAFFTEFSTDYEFHEKLGEGSYAAVYRVTGRGSTDTFAAKVVNTSLLSERSANALRNEVLVLRKIDHPNLLQLHGIYVEGTEIIFLLEYVPGGNLHRFINKIRTVPENNAMEFAREILEALEYLHSRSIIHRDIKPENVLLTGNSISDVKLADFGFACNIAKKQELRCGSPGYVAPEVLSRKDYDFKVDVFGVGVMMYIILTGTSPFQGKNQKEVLMKNKNCQIIFYEHHWKRLTLRALEFVKWLTEPNSNLRPTARQALKHPWITGEASPTRESSLLNTSVLAHKKGSTMSIHGALDPEERPRNYGFSLLAESIKRHIEQQKSINPSVR